MEIAAAQADADSHVKCRTQRMAYAHIVLVLAILVQTFQLFVRPNKIVLCITAVLCLSMKQRVVRVLLMGLFVALYFASIVFLAGNPTSSVLSGLTRLAETGGCTNKHNAVREKTRYYVPRCAVVDMQVLAVGNSGKGTVVPVKNAERARHTECWNTPFQKHPENNASHRFAVTGNVCSIDMRSEIERSEYIMNRMLAVFN